MAWLFLHVLLWEGKKKLNSYERLLWKLWFVGIGFAAEWQAVTHTSPVLVTCCKQYKALWVLSRLYACVFNSRKLSVKKLLWGLPSNNGLHAATSSGRFFFLSPRLPRLSLLSSQCMACSDTVLQAGVSEVTKVCAQVFCRLVFSFILRER